VAEHEPSSDPFAILGIAPTCDRGVVKRAYFEAVKRTPPHGDATAFRRLRSAYEALSSPRGLANAWLCAPLDSDHELQRWDARFAPRLADARTRPAQTDSHDTLDRLIARLARSTPEFTPDGSKN